MNRIEIKNPSFNIAMKRFYQIQEECSCGGSITEYEIEFYTLGYECRTIIAGEKMKNETMPETILRVCNEAVDIWKDMPEAFASKK
jgi:hypothetical protein